MPNMILETYISERVQDNDFKSRLQALSIAEASMLEKLVDILSPSANMLKGLLAVADEIAIRDKQSLQMILEDQKVSMILGNEKLNRKEKAQQIRRALEQLRFPEFSKIRAEIDSLVIGLRNDYKVHLELPENLEGDRLSFVCKFRNPEELLVSAERQAALGKDPRLARIFGLMRGEI